METIPETGRQRRVRRRREHKYFYRYAPRIVKELARHISPPLEGGHTADFAIANFSGVKQLGFLESNRAYQDILTKRIQRQFRTTNMRVEFRKGSHGDGIIVSVHFD